MKKSFILITRSYKYGGYCVAGIDIETKKWIRLVSSTDLSNNEIPKFFFEAFDDLDILEVDTVRAAPYGCQSENFVLNITVPPKKVGKCSFRELLSSNHVSAAPSLFGNFLSYLSEEEIARQSVSLGLFYVRSLCFSYYLGDDGKRHYRCRFLYKGKQYSDISVTDPVYRKDDFAWTAIDHAVLAVSLPALPYSNGKYYKFIAKIFPLPEEEATRLVMTSLSVPAPVPRVFTCEFPDASQESMSRAEHFLRSLGEGRDPDTNAALDPELLLSPSYAAWFRYCAEVVGRALPVKKSRGADSKFTYLLQDNIQKIELSDDPISASRLTERVNAVCEPNGKKLTAVAIGTFFLEAGMLREEGEEHKRKFPTDLGGEYGIVAEPRVSENGMRYFIILYGRRAQQFFLDNIDRCVEVVGNGQERNNGALR